MKEKLLKHFQTNYSVEMGHPTDENGPSLDMVYYIVRSKTGNNIRGKMNDDEWVTNVLNEIGEKYSTELFMLVLRTSNEFIESFNVKLGIRF